MRDKPEKAADEIFDDCAQAIEEYGDDPIETLEYALGEMAERWRSHVASKREP